MSLTDKVNIEIELGTLATLIAGLYCSFSAVNPIAVPEGAWILIAERLTEYLKDWDYSLESIEDWCKYDLLIIPKPMLSDDDIEDYQKNTEYFEVPNGNVLLVVTFDIPYRID